MPGLDLLPHMLSYLRSRRRDLTQPVGGDLLQRPPHGGVRGHRPEQLGLVAQGIDRTDRRGTIGDRHRQIGQKPGQASATDSALVSPTRSATSRSKPRPYMRHHTMPTHFHRQTPGPRGYIHLKSASPARWNKHFEDLYSRSSEALFAYQNTHTEKIILNIGE
jgi:hypothetical protein